MANTRLGTMSITPITGFGNQGAPAPYKDEEATYALQPLPALGTIEVACNRLARESIMNAWNQDQYSGCEGIDPREELERKTFVDENGIKKHCGGFILHPIIHDKYIKVLRSCYQDHLSISTQYDILGIRKHIYKTTQNKIANDSIARPPSQRLPLAFIPVQQQDARLPIYAEGRGESVRSLSPLTILNEDEGDPMDENVRGEEVNYDCLDRADSPTGEPDAIVSNTSDTTDEPEPMDLGVVELFLEDELCEVGVLCILHIWA
jgi:hypothetical protein